MKFYIVRHGQTLFNIRKVLQGYCDSPLTPLGIEQGKKRAELLKDQPFDAAYSSSSERAMDTCQFIIEGRNIPMFISKAFKEMNFGDKEGICAPEYFTPTSNVDYDTYFSQFGGETSKEVVDRFVNELKHIGQTTDYENVLVTAHGLCIRLVMYAIDLDKYNELTKGQYLENCAMCVVEYKDGDLHLVDVDNTKI